MSESFLYHKLKSCNFDVERQLKSYYTGGMEDPCRLEPDNVLVFFHHHSKIIENTPTLYNQRYQIKFNIGNDSIFGIDDLTFHMKPDSAIFIFPFQLHYIAAGEVPAERHHMTISFSDRGNGHDSMLPLLNRPFPVNQEDFPLLRTIVGAFQKHPGFDSGEALGCLRVFLSRKLRQVQCLPHGNVSGRDPLFESLLARVRENYNRPLNIKILAEMLGLSESYLRKMVRKQLNGIPLGAFLRHQRFSHAYELLQHTELTVREIAATCGYADIFSFSRAFKRDSGVSPTEFRKHHHEKKL